MDIWKGWVAASGSAVKPAFTWEQWRAYQALRLRNGQPSPDGSPFSASELARLSFLRWAYQTGRLDPAGSDNG